MILVTGGTGLVGSHLLYFLTLKNDKIKAIYRTEKSLEKVKTVFSFYTDEVLPCFLKIEWVKADITDIPSLEKAFVDITKVYHIAALVSFQPKEYRKMRQINIGGTATIVNFCIDKKIEKLCFVSSIATIGDSTNGKPITEENEWNENENNSEYSITKYGAEMEVWRASQEGIDIVIVNPGVILGGGFWKNGSGKLFDQIYKGFKFYTEGITGFVGVTDVANTMIQLMELSIKNERFILVSENKSFKEILFAIADVFGKKRPYIKIVKIITSIFWRVNWFFTKITKKTPLLTKSSAKSSHYKSFYLADKIVEQINFRFTPIQNVIKEVCNQYKR